MYSEKQTELEGSTDPWCWWCLRVANSGVRFILFHFRIFQIFFNEDLCWKTYK